MRPYRGLLWLCISMLLLSPLKAERVGKLKLNDGPLRFDGSSIMIEEGVVALSESLVMRQESNSTVLNSASIVFVIDHSGSMYTVDNAKDPLGNRFKVTQAIIDTLASHPERYPGIEVGLVTFSQYLVYDESDDQILMPMSTQYTNSTEYTGGYVPLLELDKSYATGRGQETGKEVLDHYLATSQPSGETYQQLAATLERDALGGTNIDAGFKAAVEALKASNNTADNQFIIFISDGESSNNTSTEYRLGQIGNDKIPTTFTIFFTNDSTPASLVEMNTAIKNNGFSASNGEHTQLWEYENSSEDSLMQFIMENIISVIEGKTQVLPQRLSVSYDTTNMTAGGWNRFSQAFTFGSIVPLKGDTSDIVYTLDARIKADSFNIATNDTVTYIVDSTLAIENQYVITDLQSAQTGEYEVMWWDRTLSLVANSQSVTSISPTDRTVLFSFVNNPLNSGYNYTNVTLELSTESGDKETIQLRGLIGQAFSQTITLDRVGAVVENDGRLSIASGETITASFCNSEIPQLPLDTLSMTFTIDSFTVISLADAAYYDTNADGFIDSLLLEFSGGSDEVAANIDELLTLVEFPQGRKFIIEQIAINGNYVGLTVVEDRTIPITSVESYDIFTFAGDVVLQNGGITTYNSLQPRDEVAPVIVSAQLDAYADRSIEDTLYVHFSEPVLDITGATPLLLLSSTGQSAIPLLKLVELVEGQDAIFAVEDYGSFGAADLADSVQIYTPHYVLDTLQKAQNNSENRVVPLEVNPITPDIGLTLKSTTLDMSEPEPEMVVILTSKVLEDFPDGGALSAKITIFDATGNRVMHGEMETLEGEGAIFRWDGRNPQNRPVGSGAYLVVAHNIRFEYVGAESNIRVPMGTQVRSMCGVKR